MQPQRNTASHVGSECKKEGEKCLKDEKYFEAMLHFTKGIKYDPHNPNIYVGRSEAFLRIQQFFYAIDDAKTVIRMLPKWPKGYLRKAEVESTAECFAEAVATLQKGLEENSGDPKLLDELEKARESWKKQRRTENRIPWFGISLGLIIGMIMIVLDEKIAKKPLFQDDYVRTISLVALVSICYALARLYRYFVQTQRSSLIEPPPDLLGDGSIGLESETSTPQSSENSRKKR